MVVALLAVGSAMIEGLVLTLTAGRQYDWRGAMASLAVAVGRRLADFIPAFLRAAGCSMAYTNIRVLNWDMKDPLSWVVLFSCTRICLLLVSPRESPRALVLGQSCRAPFAQPVQPLGRVSPRLVQQDHAVAGVLFAAGVAGLCATGHSGGVCDQSALSVLDSRRVDPEAFSEGIINTPSAHRVHHASNLEYLDANYGGVLVIFDRLFGTYVPERDDLKPRYGWVKPLTSNNPLRIVFQPWIDIVADLRKGPVGA